MFQNLSIMKGARVAVETCMKTQPDETVLIVTDTNKLRIAEAFSYAAASIGVKTVTCVMEPALEHANEPPRPIAQAMKAAEVVLIPTTKSLSHTDARRAATKAGARMASMPDINEDMMRTGGLTADYNQVATLTDKIVHVLEKAETVKITTPSGTDLTMSIKERPPMPDTGLYHKPGDWGNLPAGEVCLAPVEGTTNGILVMDSMGSVVTSPLRVTIKDGWAKKFDGPDAAKLESKLEAADKNAYNIGELGIGTNPKARITGNVLEDEKVLGTVHIALGDNTSYTGGHTKSKFHEDAILFKPTVKLDTGFLMQKGKLLIDQFKKSA